jgi:hypothetical protein
MYPTTQHHILQDYLDRLREFGNMLVKSVFGPKIGIVGHISLTSFLKRQVYSKQNPKKGTVELYLI